MIKILIFILLLSISLSQIIYSPFQASTTQVPGIINAGLIYNNQFSILAATTGGLQIYDIQNINQPFLKDTFIQTGSSILDVKILSQNSKDFLITASGIKGIYIFEINNLSINYCIQFDYIVQSVVQIDDNHIIAVGSGQINLVKFQNKQLINIKQWNNGSTSYNRVITDSLKKFLFIAGNSEGLGIYSIQKLLDQNNNPNIINVPSFEATYDITITPDNKYIYAVDMPKGLFIADIKQLYIKNTIILSDIPFIELLATQSFPNSVQISEDNNYLYLGIRTYGVEIYDVSDKLNIKLLETLDSPGYAYSVKISQNQKTLLFCNGNQFKLYEQLLPNYNKDFPNIFLGDRSTLQSLARNVNIEGVSEYLTDIGSPWRVMVDSQNNYLYIAGARSGVQIFDISDPENPQNFFNIDVDSKSNPTDGIAITENYLYIGEGKGGIKIYDISNKSNIVQLGSVFDLSGDSDGIEITKDENYMIVANGNSGVCIVDISNKASPVIKGIWENNKPGGSVENVLINLNDSLTFVSVRYYGLVILNIQNKNVDPIEISEYYSGMCEYVVLSSDENHIFLSDGTQGITILDIQNPVNPIFITSVKIDGFPTKMRLLNYSGNYYLMVATRDRELLSVIHVTDINAPYLFGKYNPGSELGYDLDFTSDLKYCYLVTNKGLRMLPMQLDINVHTEFILLDSDGEKVQSTDLPQNNNKSLLYVGQKVQVLFVPIGIGRTIQISEIQYYKDYYKDTQPSWMTFNKLQQSVILQIDKLGIEYGQQSQTNLIFATLKKQIFSSDFKNSSISINLSESQTIFNDLKQKGYISVENKITEQYQPGQELYNLDLTDPKYTDTNKMNFIQQILKNSQFTIPVKFTISQSLFFNQTEKNQDLIIQTVSDYLIFDIYILSNNALFIDKLYSKSLVIIADNKLHITIEGPKKSALVTLYEDLRIQNKIQNLSDIQLKLVIDDKINYIQEYTSNLQDMQFIKLHEGVTLNQDIQTQFNGVFADGKVEIDEEFSFQFSDSTFNSPANLPLTFQFFLEEEYGSNKYVDFPQDYWIYPNPPDRRISGTPPPSLIYTKKKVKIIASDGYSEEEDVFEIRIWNFSVFYVILQGMEIGGPILAVLGIWAYKYNFYEVFFKRNYTYTQETIITGQEFKKIIPMMRDSLKQGQFILKLINKQNFVYWDEQGNFLEQQFLQYIQEICKQNQEELENKEIHIQELQQQNSRLYQVMLGLGVLYTIKKHKSSYSLYQKIIKYSKDSRLLTLDWYLQYVQIDYKNFDIDVSNVFPIININENYLLEVIQEIQLSNNNKNKQKSSNKVSSSDQLNSMRQQYNINIIKQCLIAETKGITLDIIIFPLYSKGIGIHCNEYELDKVQGYQKVANPSCRSDGYEQCGLSSNQPLPSWLLVEVRNGCIIMKGTPRILDKGQYKFNIYMDCGCIVREFHIIVVHQQDLEQQGEQNVLKQNSFEQFRNSKNQITNLEQTQIDQSNLNILQLKQENNDNKTKIQLDSMQNIKSNTQLRVKQVKQQQTNTQDSNQSSLKKTKANNNKLIQLQPLQNSQKKDILSIKYKNQINQQNLISSNQSNAEELISQKDIDDQDKNEVIEFDDIEDSNSEDEEQNNDNNDTINQQQSINVYN